MEENKVLNLPNAARIIEALRHVGYENISALADLVDNSLDAGATEVYMQIKPTSSDYEVYIADNGKGMSMQVLDEALKLGSETEHIGESDLGKFGMGLVTASLSIARKLSVITKSMDEGYITSVQDIDEVVSTNLFVKELRAATDSETALFKSFLGNSKTGTLVILTKCDQIQDKNIDKLNDKIIAELGQIFRLFIQSGRKIFVGGIEIKPLDPLMLDNEETRLLSEDTFDITTTNGIEKVRLKMILLPAVHDTDTGVANIPNQGFYIMRNNREIAAGVTLGAFTKHNDFNRFRAEIHFSSALDQEMRVEFTKRDLKPKNIIMEEIMKATKHQLETIRKEVKKDQARSKDKEEVHEASAKSIEEKSNLLIRPEAKIEKRSQKENHTGGVSPKDTGIERTPVNTQDARSQNANVVFMVRNMGTNSQLFDVDQFGKKTIITYNSDHPFYMKVFVDNDDDTVKRYVDFMVYSLATARQVVFDDDQLEKIDQYMTIFSSNLKILMR